METNYIAPRLTKDEIIAIVERNAPDFATACQDQRAEVVVMTQAAWAVDYLIGEFTFMGLAMKYAGIKGKTVTIIPHVIEAEK